MSKKKNKKVTDDGSKKKNSEVVNEKQNEKELSGKDNPKSEEGQKKDNNGGGGGILLKTELHCEGCASKVGKFLRGFPGVENVNFDGSGKIKVSGKVDPVDLREKLEQRTHKKVELLSPVQKKDNKENPKGKDGDGKNTDGKGDKKKEENNNSGKDNKTPKQPPVTTAVLKVPLHCEGCIRKIYKIISNTKGYEEMKVEKQKDLITVKGAMDMKALAENLKKHLKKDVEIVPAKKDEKKEKGNGEGGGGESKKAVAAGNGGAPGGDGGGDKMEGNKMQAQQFGYGMGAPPPPLQQPPAYGYPGSNIPYMYGGDPYINQFPCYHAPQMFSDENPNACSIM